jgi:hypothetical protein
MRPVTLSPQGARRQGNLVCCYCKTCQRHLGTAFFTLIAVPRDSIAVEGSLMTYTETGGTIAESRYQMNIFCESVLSWVPMFTDARNFPRIIHSGLRGCPCVFCG